MTSLAEIQQASSAYDPAFDRPVFIVSPPRSGSTLLFETLQKAPRLFSIGGESHTVIEGVPGLHIRDRAFASNRLDASDLNSEIADRLRTRFWQGLKDREGNSPIAGSRVRMLEKTPKNSLRIPFLARLFPEARFLYLHRDPRQVLSSMINAWESGRFRTYLGLPGWPHPHWSLLLIPGWQELRDNSLPEIVAKQWSVSTNTILDDLAQLPRERWSCVHYEHLISEPKTEVARICARAELPWDSEIGDTLPISRYTMSPPNPEKWRRHESVINPLLPALQPTIERAHQVVTQQA